jgi:AcrR family transcriptional regulator
MGAPDRRQAILAAAARLFEHYGYAKTTMADVAREADVGVGTVYLEFDSKEAIVGELSLSTHVGVLDAMRLAAQRRTDPAERIVAVMVARTECFLALQRKGQHACELVHCGKGKADGVRAAHERFRAEEHAFLEGIVAEGRAAGAFGSLDPKVTAGLVQRAFVSLSPPWLSAGDGDVLATAKAMAELLLRGVLARPGEARPPAKPRGVSRPARSARTPRNT